MAFSGIKNLFGSKPDASKREKAFETFAIPEEFKFLKIIELQHLGLPENSTPTLTFDRFQGLLALGTLEGGLKIFGKEGIEIMLLGPDSNPIELLTFISNKGFLISYSSLNRYLTLWSLKSLSSNQIPISFRYYLKRVTKLYYDHGDYVYIGTDKGSLRVFNIEEKRLTCFELKSSTFALSPEPIVDLLLNPQNPAKLTLAFESFGVVIWDLASHKVVHKIQSDCPIHACAWAPDGGSLAIGRRDGSILLYKIEKHAKVYKNFRPDLDAGNLNVTAITVIYWLEGTMVVLGGMPFASSQQITVISGQELNDLRQVKVSGKFLPVQVLLTPLNENVETFVVMSEDEICTFALPECELEYINELYGGSEVLTSQFYTISNHGESIENVIKNVSKARISHILSGGVTDESEVYGLLITGHNEGIVRFWNVSNTRVFNVLNICLLSKGKSKFRSSTLFFDVSDSDPCKISCIELEGLRLFIGFDMGKVAVWELREKLTLANVYKYHQVPILNIKLIQQYIITGDMDGQVTIFNSETSDVSFEESESRSTQKLSITAISVINQIVYICYSNGTIKIYNPFTNEFLPSPKLSKVDLKSEVPKRGEFGILKLLHTSLQSQSIILCYERSMFNCNLADFSCKVNQFWTCPMVSCNLAHIRSDVYVYILHADCVISMLDMTSLNRLWKSALPSPLQTGFRDFHMALDGHFIITTTGKNLIAGWVTMFDEDNSVKPIVWKDVKCIDKPDRKTKSFLGIKFTSEINYSALFDRPNAKFRNDDEDFDEGPEEVKIENVEKSHAAVSDAKNAIQETLNKVSERGDKIKSLEEKMKEMTEKSKNFAMMAAEIAKKEKNKKWWQV